MQDEKKNKKLQKFFSPFHKMCIFQYNIFYYETGYYRVNYNSENWRKIIYYLNSESGENKNISVINRAKMIDAFHLMMAHQLDVSIFWEFTKYL